MRRTILTKSSYDFADYFELNYPTEAIVAELGYQYQLTSLVLPRKEIPADVEGLKNAFRKKLPRIPLTTETARREVIIAPILLALFDYLDLKLDIEYPLYVNELLHGNIDYWVRSTQDFLVIEAKKADMERGFTQLAVELIVMDQHLETNNAHLYGAITVGDSWRFGKLVRAEKLIYKDLESFRVPADLAALFQVLSGILLENEKQKDVMSDQP